MTEQPTVSGTYEYLTGGTSYNSADIQAGDHIRSLWPSVSKWLTMIRNYLPAVAAELKELGVTHIVDFASGVPDNHIHSVLTDAKVVYSDINPAVVAAGKQLTQGNPNVLYLQHDIHKPLELLESQEVKDFLGPIGKVAIGVSGVAGFIAPDDLQKISEAVYNWAPSGSLYYSEFDCKNPDKMTPKFQEFMNLMESQLGVYYLYSEEQCKYAVQPWQIRKFTTVQEYLDMPDGHIQPEDHEDVDLNFRVIIAEKP